MAQLMQPFNVGQVDPTQSEFQHVPAGDYKVIIASSEVKPTKTQDGGYIRFVYRVIEGDAAGAMLRPDIVNIYNPNPQAAEIGAKRLAAIAYAVGMGSAVINNTEELHNKPFMVRVTETDNKYVDREGNEKQNKQNNIVLIMGVDGKPPSKGNTGPGPVQPQQGPPPGAFAQPPQQPTQPPQQPPQQPPGWQQPQTGQGMPPAQQAAPAGNGAGFAPPQWGNPGNSPWGGPR